jgi:hypothetical protein
MIILNIYNVNDSYILRIQIEMYVSMYWESLLFVHCLG